jgi:hypothetical protein
MAILGISKAIGFRQDSEKKINGKLFQELRKKQKLWEYIANRNVQNAFFSFKTKSPIETGQTKKSTKAITFWGGLRLVIRFKSPNNFPSRDGKQRGYAVFPLLGLSTSAKYGQRNWLMAGAKTTLKEIVR